jgi:hypothetical protein
VRPAAFAIPGDITTLTGGYIYERRLLEGLRELGRDVLHIELGPSFADPTPADMAHAVETLAAMDPSRALILDGLVYGSIDTDGLARVRSPIVAMIHHPLALESGLSADRRAHLFRTERANLALAAHVLVPSPHTAAILARDYGVDPRRITIAGPGTDPPLGPPAPVDPPLILSVGIQHPRKGHPTTRTTRPTSPAFTPIWGCETASPSPDASGPRSSTASTDRRASSPSPPAMKATGSSSTRRWPTACPS